jgi:hypothetical protein
MTVKEIEAGAGNCTGLLLLSHNLVLWKIQRGVFVL